MVITNEQDHVVCMLRVQGLRDRALHVFGVCSILSTLVLRNNLAEQHVVLPPPTIVLASTGKLESNHPYLHAKASCSVILAVPLNICANKEPGFVMARIERTSCPAVYLYGYMTERLLPTSWRENIDDLTTLLGWSALQSGIIHVGIDDIPDNG
eukprot:TRINITY_DN11573_c0_g1_i2.p1 TRINITY_DN11573_c0_g1~~TRINITY_DN11573_c0_g1_i2.p1  ORF type:complete len:154 (+),score=16.38 TRINITY_DN11573_c0_g1_i2:300-761(+)